MKFLRSRIAIVILIFGIILQAIVFNRYDLYTIHFQVAWILLIGLFTMLSYNSLPLIGAVSGWAIASLSSFSPLVGAILGLFVAVLGQIVVKQPAWALSWIRVTFLLILNMIISCYWIVLSPNVDTLFYSLIFTVVNVVGASILFNFLQEPLSDE